jgi:hypothetical protein
VSSQHVGPNSWTNPFFEVLYKIPIVQRPGEYVYLQTTLSKN